MILFVRKTDPNDPRTELEIMKDHVKSMASEEIYVRQPDFLPKTRIGGQNSRFSIDPSISHGGD
jgi:hypothetical protein